MIVYCGYHILMCVWHKTSGSNGQSKCEIQKRKVREGGGREGKEDGQEGLRGSVGGRCTYLYGEGVTGDKAGVELVKSPLENLVHQTC